MVLSSFDLLVAISTNPKFKLNQLSSHPLQGFATYILLNNVFNPTDPSAGPILINALWVMILNKKMKREFN